VIAYFDTSAVVPLLVEEPATPRAARLWDEAERVVTVRLCYAEARAALAMARRIGRIRPAALRLAVQTLHVLYGQMDLVEVTDGVVRRAGSLAEEHELRGYDAVHLASAETLADPEIVLVAGDDPLCRAAASQGLAVARLAD
jgi:uncharacterized protein